MWESDRIQEDVPVNACVVHDTKTEEFFVFMTTDISKTARQIIQTYELRPEIDKELEKRNKQFKLPSYFGHEW